MGTTLRSTTYPISEEDKTAFLKSIEVYITNIQESLTKIYDRYIFLKNASKTDLARKNELNEIIDYLETVLEVINKVIDIIISKYGFYDFTKEQLYERLGINQELFARYKSIVATKNGSVTLIDENSSIIDQQKQLEDLNKERHLQMQREYIVNLLELPEFNTEFNAQTELTRINEEIKKYRSWSSTNLSLLHQKQLQSLLTQKKILDYLNETNETNEDQENLTVDQKCFRKLANIFSQLENGGIIPRLEQLQNEEYRSSGDEETERRRTLEFLRTINLLVFLKFETFKTLKELEIEGWRRPDSIDLRTSYSERLIRSGNSAFKVIGGILMTSLNLTAFAASSIARLTTFGYLGKTSANIYKKNLLEGLEGLVQNLSEGLTAPFFYTKKEAGKTVQEIVKGEILSLKDIVMKSIPEQYNTSDTSNTYDYNSVYKEFENKGGKTRNLRKLKSFNKKTIRRHNKKHKLKNKVKSNKRMNKNKKSKRNNK